MTDSVWPSAPTGLRDGAYPVLVRRTDSRDGDLTELFLVDSDSWYLAPCGRNWRVEYVLQAGGAAGDRFCYTVETVEHLEELAGVGPNQAPRILYPAGTAGGEALRMARKGLVLDRTAVAGGVVLTTPVLDLTGIESLTAIVDNSAGGVTRQLSWTQYLDDGVTALITETVGATVGAGVVAKLRLGALPVGDVLQALPTKAAFSLAAGGSAAATVTTIGR